MIISFCFLLIFIICISSIKRGHNISIKNVIERAPKKKKECNRQYDFWIVKKNICGSITGLKFWDLGLVVVVVF